jgi:hypothetical protein
MTEYWWVLLAAILVAMVFLWRWSPLGARSRAVRFPEARRDFHRQRERLEAKFLQLGMYPSRPDSPRWADVEFDDDVIYARNRSTGELSAFVAVTILIEDSPSDRSTATEATRTQREATAVFRFEGRHWETDGRAIFNKSPSEALRFYHRDLELVAQEVANH